MKDVRIDEDPGSHGREATGVSGSELLEFVFELAKLIERATLVRESGSSACQHVSGLDPVMRTDLVGRKLPGANQLHQRGPRYAQLRRRDSARQLLWERADRDRAPVRHDLEDPAEDRSQIGRQRARTRSTAGDEPLGMPTSASRRSWACRRSAKLVTSTLRSSLLTSVIDMSNLSNLFYVHKRAGFHL